MKWHTQRSGLDSHKRSFTRTSRVSVCVCGASLYRLSASICVPVWLPVCVCAPSLGVAAPKA
jgi:hypothetical protein